LVFIFVEIAKSSISQANVAYASMFRQDILQLSIQHCHFGYEHKIKPGLRLPLGMRKSSQEMLLDQVADFLG